MADTVRKTVTLVGQDLLAPNVPPLQAFTPVEWAPLAAAMRAQDSIPGTANRVLARVGLAGQHEFPVDDSLTTASASQHYPEAEVWRTVWGPLPRRYTPGAELEAHVVYLPSGMTQRNVPDWEPDGARGGIRVICTWSNGAASDQAAFELDLPGSGLPNGVEPVGNGSSWAAIKEAIIEQMRPPGSGTDSTIAQDFSEWGEGSYADAGTKKHEVTLEIQIRGGARIVEAIVYEVPLAHVQDHDETGPQSVHAFWAAGGPPIVPQTPVPQTEAADGPNHEEHRFGTTRLVETADWQSQRLGPAVLGASSWVSGHGPPFPVTADPWTITATEPTEVMTGATAYDEDAPGWLVAGAYALPRGLNEPVQILAEGSRAVIPVRVHCDAVVTGAGGGGGWVRVQSSDTEWVDVQIPHNSHVDHTQVGYLESQVHPDHARAELQVFAWVVDAGDELEMRNVSVDFGEW